MNSTTLDISGFEYCDIIEHLSEGLTLKRKKWDKEYIIKDRYTNTIYLVSDGVRYIYNASAEDLEANDWLILI